jgi:hypothetical protein
VRLVEQSLQIAAAIHLQGDVAAADEFAVDVQLRIGGPVRIALQALAQLRVLEDVHMLELGAAGAQRRNGLRRESTLREIGRALHEEHDWA